MKAVDEMIRVTINTDRLNYEIGNILRIFYKNTPIEFTLSQKTKGLTIDGTGPRIFIEVFIDDGDDTLILTRLFLLLREKTGVDPPYGMLTGVRPAKIYSEMSKEGYSPREITEVLEKKYFVKGEKTALLYHISLMERKIEKTYQKNDISVYIGIPFCPSKCKYCSFTSYPIDKYPDGGDGYVNALCREIEEINKSMIHGRKEVKTIYVGGGTPTSLNYRQLETLLGKISDTYDLSRVHEYTVEAGRPDTLDDTRLKILKDYKVERISINPQTMNEDTLKLIGRGHGEKTVYKAYEAARAHGFENINMDVIIGLPGETEEMFEQTMKKICRLNPESITVHSLAIKRASEFKIRGNQTLTDDSRVLKMAQLAAQYTRGLGMVPYYLYRQKNISGNLENIGYAKPGYECAYNVLIMGEFQSILAFGAGGVSKFIFPEENRIERSFNVKDPLLYIQRLDEMIGRKMVFIDNF